MQIKKWTLLCIMYKLRGKNCWPPNCVSDLPNSRLSGHADPQLPSVISSAGHYLPIMGVYIVYIRNQWNAHQRSQDDPLPAHFWSLKHCEKMMGKCVYISHFWLEEISLASAIYSKLLLCRRNWMQLVERSCMRVGIDRMRVSKLARQSELEIIVVNRYLYIYKKNIYIIYG